MASISFLKAKIASYLSKEQKQAVKNIIAVITSFFGGNRKKIRGRNNAIIVKYAYLSNVIFDIIGDDNVIFVKKGTKIKNTKIIIRGSGHKVQIGEDCILDGGALCFEDSNCSISIGDRTVIHNHFHIAAVEPNATIHIGNGCLFSSYIDIRTTDSHSILDMNTGERINRARDINIGDHVWLGMSVAVLKGASIGKNSVIGYRAVVTKDIADNCVAVGFPAHVIKQNTTWACERM